MWYATTTTHSGCRRVDGFTFCLATRHPELVRGPHIIDQPGGAGHCLKEFGINQQNPGYKNRQHEQVDDQSFEDARRSLRENEAKQQGLPESDPTDSLTDEERSALQEQAADRFERIGEEPDDAGNP